MLKHVLATVYKLRMLEIQKTTVKSVRIPFDGILRDWNFLHLRSFYNQFLLRTPVRGVKQRGDSVYLDLDHDKRDT